MLQWVALLAYSKKVVILNPVYGPLCVELISISSAYSGFNHQVQKTWRLKIRCRADKVLKMYRIKQNVSVSKSYEFIRKFHPIHLAPQ